MGNRLLLSDYTRSMLRCMFCSRSMRSSTGGWLENSVAMVLPFSAGTMKNALACSTCRRSFSGMRYMSLLIFCNADANCNGRAGYLRAASVCRVFAVARQRHYKHLTDEVHYDGANIDRYNHDEKLTGIAPITATAA